MDHSTPGSSVLGILQVRILEWGPCPPPRDLPHPGIEPASLTSPALVGGFLTTSAAWEAPKLIDSLFLCSLYQNVPNSGETLGSFV